MHRKGRAEANLRRGVGEVGIGVGEWSAHDQTARAGWTFSGGDRLG